MRFLPLALALVLAIPATVVVALPRALPDAPEPVGLPLGGSGDETGENEETADAPASRPSSHDGHTASAAPATTDGAHTHARERTVWPAAQGAIPTSKGALVEVRDILIQGEPDLGALEEIGVELAGSGTLADPYVLEGLWVKRELEIKDTADYYVVKNSIISGTLRLNWNDDRVHVHHNDVRDLRVNENIERIGEATGGLIELNRFGVVGQIRHFDGVFRHNEVGPAPAGAFDDVIEDSGAIVPFFGTERIMNIDGFDGAIFQENTFVGYVEMQLHGHHHASCFGCHSHNHAVSKPEMKHDHSIRYHEADFIANTITVEEGLAFRYTDAAHSGDDRTATSEPNKALREPHVHFTRIAIEDNVVQGGPLVIDILNADSRDHANEKTEIVEQVAVFDGHAYRAQLSLRGNEVAYAVPEKPLVVPWLEEVVRDGILVQRVKEAHVDIAGNLVLLTGSVEPGPFTGVLGMPATLVGGEAAAALHLLAIESARVGVESNAFEGAHFGILAQEFAEQATWVLASNEFRGVATEVEHDERSAPEA